MNLKEEDLVKTSKLLSQQIDHVTCIQCCKYYIAPETAPCGHTLCHMCWRECLTCPCCAKSIDRSTLKLNRPLQVLKENVLALGDAYEKLFKIKVAEVLLDVETNVDPTTNVKAWLSNSQNHFSAPPHNSENSSQDIAELQNLLNVSSNKILIHTNTTKPKQPEPENTVFIPKIVQDDWDKIEALPDTEDINKKGKENVVGPMDIEPFYIDDENEYTANNPRRSSRKRDLKPSNENNNDNNILTKQISKDSCEETDKKSSTAKQNWNNVKRMRKEFSKLNKKNRNKLNVSIEMFKKGSNVAKTCDAPLPALLAAQYDIDENTPNNDLCKKHSPQKHNSNESDEKIEVIPVSDKNNRGSSSNIDKSQLQTSRKTSSDIQNKSNAKVDVSQKSNVQIINTSKEQPTNSGSIQTNTKMPFYKKSSLIPNPKSTNKDNEQNVNKTVNHIVETNSDSNDDIEITIKVRNTTTNIILRMKNNDMQLKTTCDRDIQTSLGPHEITQKTSTPKSQSIFINVGDNNEVDVTHHAVSNPRVEELKKGTTSEKTTSERKHTDSADTGTAQFEITASVEKELSKIMEIEDNIEQERTKTITVTTEKSFETNESQKPTNKQPKIPKATDEDKKSTKSIQSQKAPSNCYEYFNDIDIFDSEPVKEQSVQYLKNTEPAASEILLSTAKTRNRTQKATQPKRGRGAYNDDELPKSKKAKHDDTNVTAEQNKSTQNHTDSEPINYDAIMDTVFANIDAEIGESQNIIKNTYTLEDKKSQNYLKVPTQDKLLQESWPSVEKEVNQLGKNQKDSENLFSTCVEKDENEVTSLVSIPEKIPEKAVASNLGDLLTPVMSQAVDNDVQMANDDSDVVEETPQKTSFTKFKPKSNGANREREATQSQQSQLPMQNEPSKPATEDINSVVNITDVSTRTDVNETTIKAAVERPAETPLTIDKFVHQIQHKSTPYAKKSLNFDTQTDDITLCPTTEGVANTTQEKEFMLKAFEKTPSTIAKQTPMRSLALKHKKFVIAGSCMSSEEIAVLNKLCERNKWTYTNKYTSDLTHLVVKVDEENKAQRTIKYMSALAASKWIVSYKWVVKCLQSKHPVNEEEFEVLDSTGHPGPMLSRIATKKLFQGITFYCMEPFGVLDVNTLKEMITSAGGTVAKEVRAIRVTDKSGPALLLAEPENTQEDRFIYLAMELTIVPVNHEWILNCLGSYSLQSIHDLLLCPASLLPKATEKWPPELLARDEGDDE